MSLKELHLSLNVCCEFFFVCVFCYHTSHLYHVRLIDGAASIIIFLLHGDARSRNFLMSGSIFCILPPYAEREKKSAEYGDFFAYADGGNRTRAANTASSRAIHYTIAPRLCVVNSSLKNGCLAVLPVANQAQ